MRIMGLFLEFAMLNMPACLGFFLLTAAPMISISWSSFPWSSEERRDSLRSTSDDPNRQTFRWPSAVSLRRLQEPQKFWLMEVMNPTRPGKWCVFQVGNRNPLVIIYVLTFEAWDHPGLWSVILLILDLDPVKVRVFVLYPLHHFSIRHHLKHKRHKTSYFILSVRFDLI